MEFIDRRTTKVYVLQHPPGTDESAAAANASSRTDVRPPSRLIQVLPLLALSAPAFVAAAAFTWQKTPGLYDDFTREVFIFRVISRGGLFNRDIFSIFGPLSALVNGGLMRVCGDSIAVVLAANLAVIFSVMVVVCLLLERLFSRPAAAAGALVFILLFAFAQYGSIESFNFAAPYSHDLTYGALFSLLALYFLTAPPSKTTAVLGGACCGLVLLTKIELVAALGLAAGFQVAANLVRRTWSPARAAWFVAGALTPVVASLALLIAQGVGFSSALASTLAAVLVFFDSAQVISDPYYRRFIGLDLAGQNTFTMVREALKVFALIPLAAGLTWTAGKMPGRWEKPATALLVALLGLLFFAGPIELAGAPQGLPILLAAMAAWSLRSPESRAEALKGRLAFYLFAFLMLAKIILFCRLYHYGFALALPATLAVVGFLGSDFPEMFKKRRPALAVGALALAAFAWPYLKLSYGWYADKTFAVGRGADRIITAPPGDNPYVGPTAEAIAWLEQNTRPDQTVTALPVGAVFNLLTGRESRLPFGSYTLVDMAHFDEGKMLLEPLRRDPPDFIVITHYDTRQFYGIGFFGQDPRYGQLTMRWVGKNYEEAARFGAEPLRDRRFGVKVLRPKR